MLFEQNCKIVFVHTRRNDYVLNISRRSFLKYTAVAAVAVAGSSLLTGCKDDDNTAKRTKLGAITVLQAKADLTSVEYTGGSLVFKLKIKNNRTNPFEISYDHFCVMVTDVDGKKTYYTYKDLSKLKLETVDLSDPQLTKNSNVECTITATGLTEAIKPTDTVTLIYYPDHTYGEYSARWNLLVSDGEVTLPTSSAK